MRVQTPFYKGLTVLVKTQLMLSNTIWAGIKYSGGLVACSGNLLFEGEHNTRQKGSTGCPI